MPLLLPALLTLTTLALADDPLPDEADAPRVVRAAVTELDLDGATIEGEVVHPGNQLVIERPRATFRSAIRLRDNFLDVAVESAEQVR